MWQDLVPGEELKKKDSEELKKELRKAKHQLKQYELKIKSIEEEQKQQVIRVYTNVIITRVSEACILTNAFEHAR